MNGRALLTKTPQTKELRRFRRVGVLISVAFCVSCWSPLDEFWGMFRGESLRNVKISAESHDMRLIKEVSKPYSTVYPEHCLSGHKWSDVELAEVIAATGNKGAQLPFFDNGPWFQIDSVGINGSSWRWPRKKFGRFTVKECWRPAVIRYCDRDLVEAGYGVRQVQRGQLKVDIGDKQFWQLNPDSSIGGELCGFGRGSSRLVSAIQKIDLESGDANKSGSEDCEEKRIKVEGIVRRPVPKGFGWAILGSVALGLSVSGVYGWWLILQNRR
jgi:hypothetical protein